MPSFNHLPPLSLYVHLPWCIKKCPYCDFNSHAVKEKIPEEVYINALLDDFKQHLALIQNRPLVSIFLGGGTPSLFSAQAIARLLQGLQAEIDFNPEIEITLEANPGVVDEAQFAGFKAAGVNRLSIGIQSFNEQKLKLLGRIHNHERAIHAIQTAKKVGFSNINIDLMHGLPEQTKAEAVNDVMQALSFKTPHLSWYQLTLEPNTLFYHQPPILPKEEVLWDIQQEGEFLLTQQLKQYEISAYAMPDAQCIHNKNYWEFGDYLGIGAGAHSKISSLHQVNRFAQVKHPRDYLQAEKRKIFNTHTLSEADLIFEFMLNALRLIEGVPFTLFTERTGLSIDTIESYYQQAMTKKLLLATPKRLQISALGKRFLNDLTAIFLPNTKIARKKHLQNDK